MTDYSAISKKYGLSETVLRKCRKEHMPRYLIFKIAPENGFVSIDGLFVPLQKVLQAMREAGYVPCRRDEDVFRGKLHYEAMRRHYIELGKAEELEEMIAAAENAFPCAEVVR